METFQENQQHHTVSLIDNLIEADIFAPKVTTLEQKAEELALFEFTNDLYEELLTASKRLETLNRLFTIQKHGDKLSSTYKVSFNDSTNQGDDEVSELIMKTFVADHSLNIDGSLDKLKNLKDFFEYKTLKNKPQFCEVDILSEEKKEPVLC